MERITLSSSLKWEHFAGIEEGCLITQVLDQPLTAETLESHFDGSLDLSGAVSYDEFCKAHATEPGFILSRAHHRRSDFLFE